MTDATAPPKPELPIPNIPLIHRPNDVASQSSLSRPPLADSLRLRQFLNAQPSDP